MKIKRVVDGVEHTFELTDEELDDTFTFMREQHFREWVRTLLDEYYYDPDKVEPDVFDAIYETYMNVMTEGDELGVAEHNAFEYALDVYGDDLASAERTE